MLLNICGHKSAMIIPVKRNAIPNTDSKSWYQKPQHFEFFSSLTDINLLKIPNNLNSMFSKKYIFKRYLITNFRNIFLYYLVLKKYVELDIFKFWDIV